MSSTRTTLMLVVPGRRTLSLELGPRWPAAVLGALCVPLLMGAAARRCADAWQHDGVQCRVASADVTGSLFAVTRPTLAAPSSEVARVARSIAPRSNRVAPPPRRVAKVAIAAAMPNPLAMVGTAPALRGGALPMAMLTAIGPGRAARAPALPSRAAPAGPTPSVDGLSPGVLRVQALHLGESVRVRPFDDDGVADPAAFAALSHLMRCRITGREIEIDARLVRVLAQISAAYNRPIQLVSGHRQPHVIGTSSTSQHTLGKAADIRVAGVGVEELRDLAVKLGARGVGMYPEKGFVHVDVRERKYHWTYTQADGELRDLH